MKIKFNFITLIDMKNGIYSFLEYKLIKKKKIVNNYSIKIV